MANLATDRPAPPTGTARVEWRCRRCDQVLVPGQLPPRCLGGRYGCDPTNVRSVPIAPPCRCQAPTPAAPDTPEPEPDRRVEPDEDDRVAVLRQWARELGRMPGRDAVKAKFNVGSGTANKLREDAERAPIRAVQ